MNFEINYTFDDGQFWFQLDQVCAAVGVPMPTLMSYVPMPARRRNAIEAQALVRKLRRMTTARAGELADWVNATIDPKKQHSVVETIVILLKNLPKKDQKAVISEVRRSLSL